MVKKILIVDDEPDVRQMLKFKLETNGYKINEADNGLAAVMMVQKDPPDLIILDLMLPKIDGFRVCSLIKRDSKHYGSIPVIILTARAGENDELLAKESGADIYVTKPLNLDLLLLKVKELLKE